MIFHVLLGKQALMACSCGLQNLSRRNINTQMEIDQDGHNTCDEYMCASSSAS